MNVILSGLDFYVSRGGSVYRSSNRGVNWTPAFSGSIGPLSHVNFTQAGSLQSGWAISASGGIAGFSGTATYARETRRDAPLTFELMQNYPNPFNPSTTLKFTIPYSSFIILKVYDLLGREVATLVNEKQNVGTFLVRWDASHVSSGVYFYRLQAGESVQTRKLLLLR